jgi:TolA-binding protein
MRRHVAEDGKIGLSRVLRAALLGALVTGGTVGCVTSSEGDQIRADLVNLQKKLGDVSQRQDARVQELDRVLKEATRFLGSSSASVGAEVDRMRSDLVKLNGRLDQVNHDFAQLQRQIQEFKARAEASGARPGGAVVAPQDPAQLLSNAQQALSGSRYDEARRLGWAFLRSFKADPRAAMAQMVVAESYYSQGQFPQAAAEYQKVVDYYPASGVVPDALLKIGLSFFEQKQCAEARAFLGLLIKKHAASSAAREARNTLRDVQRASKNRNRCRS